LKEKGGTKGGKKKKREKGQKDRGLGWVARADEDHEVKKLACQDTQRREKREEGWGGD